MQSSSKWLLLWTLAAFIQHTPVSAVSPSSNWMTQGFFFDWNDPAQPTPVPITAQCETLHIKWSKGTATGPDPVAPYTLALYTSNYVVPFIIDAGSGSSLDFAVPFAPGTQYVACMYDSKGVTGGCQAMYTVYSVNPTPTCANLTFPAKAMNVETATQTGALSQFGWPNQCTDIQVTPKEGTPPYTLTINPALRPPLNITSKTMAPINWTITLGHGFPFFVSLVDSSGLTWSNGPLHAGANGPTSCLDPNGSQLNITLGGLIGGSVGGLIVGAVLTIFVAYLVERGYCAFGRQKNRHDDTLYDVQPYSAGDYNTRPNLYHSLPSQPDAAWRVDPATAGTLDLAAEAGLNRVVSHDPTIGGGMGSTLPSHYAAEAYEPHNPTSDYVSTTGSGSGTASARPSKQPMGGRPSMQLRRQSTTSGASATAGQRQQESAGVLSPTSATGRQNQVYVVHHDGGRAPVTVYTAEGTQVVELPPSYAAGSQASLHEEVGAADPRPPPQAQASQTLRPTVPDPRVLAGPNAPGGSSNLPPSDRRAEKKRSRSQVRPTD